MDNWIYETFGNKWATYEKIECSKCRKLVGFGNTKYDDEKSRIKKYNFCPLCRDKKGDINPSDAEAHETWDLASNGWVDCGCSACGYTENVDFPGHLGYKNCPICGAVWTNIAPSPNGNGTGL